MTQAAVLTSAESAATDDLEAYCLATAKRARGAAGVLVQLPTEAKDAWLKQSAIRIRERQADILQANALDVAAAPSFGLSEAQIDRLKLTPARIADIAKGLDEVAALPDPNGEVMETLNRPNGLKIEKTRVPLGVVFFIYESRPNVTADAAAICLKSGNAVILRGGKEAAHSSRAIVDILRDIADEVGLPSDAIHLVETADRSAVGHFLNLPQYIDLAIPRGGEGLIRRVAAEAKMPVIKHFNGNCHVYVEQTADLAMAERITINAKCQRMGVCNACESLLVDEAIADEFLPRIGRLLQEHGVEIRGDARTCKLIPGSIPATEEDWATEFLGPIISVKVVSSLDDAVAHITRYGSQHTESIITRDAAAAKAFTTRVDSSAVMVNASTRFNDGGVFGLGAEIGISTDKFHARGPCGLKELMTYKWIVWGDGQIRE